MAKFAVIGLGKFGYKLATTLAHKGAEVMAIDRDKKLVDQIKDEVSVAICLDSRDLEALQAVGLDEVDVAVVSIGEDFESRQLATLHLKEIGVPKIIAKALNPVQGQIMRLIGADEVINPEEEMGKTLAERLVIPNIQSHMKLSEDHSLIEMPVPRKFVGKSILELELRKRYNVIIVYIRKLKKNRKHTQAEEEEHWEGVIPAPNYIFEEGDLLFVLGKDNDARDFAAAH